VSDLPHHPDAADLPGDPGHGDRARELEVDLRSFLPEGVSLGDPDESDPEESDPDAVDPDEVDSDEVEADEPHAGAVAAPAPPVDLEALGGIERDLDGVDAALRALDAGTYGACTSCGAPIDDALLAADPVRTGCADHPAA
jgi:RNA polymerase-binding transcription factor DksA